MFCFIFIFLSPITIFMAKITLQPNRLKQNHFHTLQLIQTEEQERMLLTWWVDMMGDMHSGGLLSKKAIQKIKRWRGMQEQEKKMGNFLKQSIFSIQLWFKKRKYLFIYFLVKKNKTKENTIWLIFVLVCMENVFGWLRNSYNIQTREGNMFFFIFFAFYFIYFGINSIKMEYIFMHFLTLRKENHKRFVSAFICVWVKTEFRLRGVC